MSVTDNRIRILGEVFAELREILGELKKMTYIAFTHTEQTFIAILEDVLKNEDTDSYDNSLLKLNPDALDFFYNNVKAFVTEFSARIHMETAERMDLTGTTGVNTGQATEGRDLGNKWIYLGNGRFQAKEGAMLRLLNRYVEHEGRTWKDHSGIFDIKGNERNFDDVEDYDLIYPGEEVQFPSELTHIIDEKLAELDYVVKAPVDLLRFKCVKTHDEKMGGNTRVIYRMDNTFEYWIDEENDLAGWHPESFQKFFGFADFYDDLSKPIFRFDIGEITLNMGAYTVRLWHGDYGAIANDIKVLEGLDKFGLGAETGVYNISNAAQNGVEDGKIRDQDGNVLLIPTATLDVLEHMLDGAERKGDTEKIEDIEDAIKDMKEDWGHSLSYEEMDGHGIEAITTELWIVDENGRTLRGAVTEQGNWPNLYSLNNTGTALNVDSAHIFRFKDDKKAELFFKQVVDAIDAVEEEHRLKASIVGDGLSVRLEWFDVLEFTAPLKLD